jgi:hypothetical protein
MGASSRKVVSQTREADFFAFKLALETLHGTNLLDDCTSWTGTIGIVRERLMF